MKTAGQPTPTTTGALGQTKSPEIKQLAYNLDNENFADALGNLTPSDVAQLAGQEGELRTSQQEKNAPVNSETAQELHEARAKADERKQKLIFSQAERDSQEKLIKARQYLITLAANQAVQEKMGTTLATEKLIASTTRSLDGAQGSVSHLNKMSSVAERIALYSQSTKKAEAWMLVGKRKENQRQQTGVGKVVGRIGQAKAVFASAGMETDSGGD